MTLDTHQRVDHVARRSGGMGLGQRALAEEVPVALTYNGSTQAVMMATPSDLEDFAVGFSLSERIINAPAMIEQIEVVDQGAGIDLQIRLTEDAGEALAKRRRLMAGPVGCGLCGIESIEQALRPVEPVPLARLALSQSDVANAVRLLAGAQPLNRETSATHAAGFYVPSKGIVMAREDVGRHNALDKLVGAMARAEIDGGTGAVVITSRVSVEMVQKTAVSGAPALLAMSAPTALAVRTAEAAGITLVAAARGEDFEIFTHPTRIAAGGIADVA